MKTTLILINIKIVRIEFWLLSYSLYFPNGKTILKLQIYIKHEINESTFSDKNIRRIS